MRAVEERRGRADKISLVKTYPGHRSNSVSEGDILSLSIITKTLAQTNYVNK